MHTKEILISIYLVVEISEYRKKPSQNKIYRTNEVKRITISIKHRHGRQQQKRMKSHY